MLFEFIKDGNAVGSSFVFCFEKNTMRVLYTAFEQPQNVQIPLTVTNDGFALGLEAPEIPENYSFPRERKENTWYIVRRENTLHLTMNAKQSEQLLAEVSNHPCLKSDGNCLFIKNICFAGQ